MSATLHWRPVENSNHPLYDLRWTLCEYLRLELGNDVQVGRELIPFLEGVMLTASSEDLAAEATALIQAIRRYGTIELFLVSD
jgi:hypothetical protein